MKNVLLITAILFLSVTSFATGPATVIVSDSNFYGPNGKTGNWNASIVSPFSFTTYDGYPVQAGYTSKFTITGTTFSVPVIPNILVGNTYTYNVNYTLTSSGGPLTFSEHWCVPNAAGPFTRAQVLCSGTIPPVVMPVVGIANGGTGATTAAGACSNLGCSGGGGAGGPCNGTTIQCGDAQVGADFSAKTNAANAAICATYPGGTVDDRGLVGAYLDDNGNVVLGSNTCAIGLVLPSATITVASGYGFTGYTDVAFHGQGFSNTTFSGTGTTPFYTNSSATCARGSMTDFTSNNFSIGSTGLLMNGICFLDMARVSVNTQGTALSFGGSTGSYYNTIRNSYFSAGPGTYAVTVGYKYGTNANSNALRDLVIDGDGGGSTSVFNGFGAASNVYDHIDCELAGLCFDIRGVNNRLHNSYFEGTGYAVVPGWTGTIASAGSCVLTNGNFEPHYTGPTEYRDPNGNIEMCTIAGSWASASPAWNATIGGTTAVGSATFTNMGPYTTWPKNTVLDYGAIVIDSNNYSELVVVGGTTGSTQPAWTTFSAMNEGALTTDGSVTYELIGYGTSIVLEPSASSTMITDNCGSAMDLSWSPNNLFLCPGEYGTGVTTSNVVLPYLDVGGFGQAHNSFLAQGGAQVMQYPTVDPVSVTSNLPAGGDTLSYALNYHTSGSPDFNSGSGFDTGVGNFVSVAGVDHTKLGTLQSIAQDPLYNGNEGGQCWTTGDTFTISGLGNGNATGSVTASSCAVTGVTLTGAGSGYYSRATVPITVTACAVGPCGGLEVDVTAYMVIVKLPKFATGSSFPTQWGRWGICKGATTTCTPAYYFVADGNQLGVTLWGNQAIFNVGQFWDYGQNVFATDLSNLTNTTGDMHVGAPSGYTAASTLWLNSIAMSRSYTTGHLQIATGASTSDVGIAPSSGGTEASLALAYNSDLAAGHTFTCSLTSSGLTCGLGNGSTTFNTTYVGPVTAPTFCLGSSCINVWPGGGGSPGFNAITSGTNTLASMVMGTGSSLTSTGGTIAATTAAAAASTPTLCSTGQAPTGVLANFNATGCATYAQFSGSIAANSFPYWNSTNTLTGLSVPTGPTGVPQVPIYTYPTGWSLGAATIPINNNSETNCAGGILSILDRAAGIFCSGTTTATFTLPVHSTSGFGVGFPFFIFNGNSGNLTLSPTTDTISTSTVFPNWVSFVYNNPLGNWQNPTMPTVGAFPSCSDTGGNHLNFVNGTGITCGTSSSGGGGGYTLQIGGSSLTSGDTVNFNNTTPAAETNAINVHFQTSKVSTTDSVSAEIVGDGNSAHYIDGTGHFTSPAAAGSSQQAMAVAMFAGTTSVAAPTAGTLSIQAITYPLTSFSYFLVDISTGDGTNNSDFAIYGPCTSGQSGCPLFAHTGGITTSSGVGHYAIAATGSPTCTSAPCVPSSIGTNGFYYVAYCSAATTLAIYKSNTQVTISPYNTTIGSTCTAGVAPSTINLGSDSWAASSAFIMGVSDR